MARVVGEVDLESGGEGGGRGGDKEGDRRKSMESPTPAYGVGSSSGSGAGAGSGYGRVGGLRRSGSYMGVDSPGDGMRERPNVPVRQLFGFHPDFKADCSPFRNSG